MMKKIPRAFVCAVIATIVLALGSQYVSAGSVTVPVSMPFDTDVKLTTYYIGGEKHAMGEFSTDVIYFDKGITEITVKVRAEDIVRNGTGYKTGGGFFIAILFLDKNKNIVGTAGYKIVVSKPPVHATESAFNGRKDFEITVVIPESEIIYTKTTPNKGFSEDDWIHIDDTSKVYGAIVFVGADYTLWTGASINSTVDEKIHITSASIRVK